MVHAIFIIWMTLMVVLAIVSTYFNVKKYDNEDKKGKDSTSGTESED